jgi:hypothetical protein
MALQMTASARTSLETGCILGGWKNWMWIFVSVPMTIGKQVPADTMAGQMMKDNCE